MSQQTLIILIIAFACCALVGAVLTAMRAKRFVRGQRARDNQIIAQSMAEVSKVKKDTEATQEQ